MTNVSSRLRSLALTAVMVGGPVSVLLMIYAARRFHPHLAVALLFVVWVFSPFALLMVAELVSPSWSDFTHRALYSAMLVVTLVTLTIYGVLAFMPPRIRLVPIFVLVPPCSWVLIVVAIAIAALISRSRTPRAIR